MFSEKNDEACHSKRKLSTARSEVERRLLLLPFIKRTRSNESELPGAACIGLGHGGTAYIEAMCLMVEAIQD